jgi:hypothetical protein
MQHHEVRDVHTSGCEDLTSLNLLVCIGQKFTKSVICHCSEHLPCEWAWINLLTLVSKKVMETSLYPRTLSHIIKMKRNCSLNLIKRLTVSFTLVQQNVVCLVTGLETLP